MPRFKSILLFLFPFITALHWHKNWLIGEGTIESEMKNILQNYNENIIGIVDETQAKYVDISEEII